MEFLDQINTLLTDKFGPLGPLYAVGMLGVLFIVLTLPMLLKRNADPLDKLKNQGHRPPAKGSKDEPEQARLRASSGGTDKLDKFANFLEPQDEEEYDAARLKLMRAGYRSKSAVRAFHFVQLVLGLGFLFCGVLYAVVNSASNEAVSTQSLVLSVVIPGGIGYFLPKYWVERRVQERQQEIIDGFPDGLDMLLVCVEAGQSLDQAIIRVSKEIRAGYPSLAEELEIVSHEVKAGKDKPTVLKDMGERCGVPDVSSFVTVLVQSATFGTSIADALRVFAAEMRDKRVMRAEEKANKLPTKLTLGTMMFTVPPLLVILIGPSCYGIYQMLSNAQF